MNEMTVKKRRMAATLKYDEGDIAPKLTAFGEGEAAEKIIELALKEGVPVYREDNLIKDLKKLEIGREIPPELYEIVAEILAFIYYLDEKEGKKEYDGKEGNRGSR